MKKKIHIVDLALMDNEGTGNPYPTSPHEWMSVKAVEERDAEIEELASKYEVLLLRANDVAAENHRLAEEVERLRAALQPFALAYFQTLHNSESWHGVLDRMSLADFAAAIDEFGGYSGMLADESIEEFYRLSDDPNFWLSEEGKARAAQALEGGGREGE